MQAALHPQALLAYHAASSSTPAGELAEDKAQPLAFPTMHPAILSALMPKWRSCFAGQAGRG